jgi:energy-coupling factor transport system permease protein
LGDFSPITKYPITLTELLDQIGKSPNVGFLAIPQTRKSFIQSFDPRAWVKFYLCFLFSTLFFWDVRFLLPFFLIALFTLLTSGVKWYEIKRAFLFIGAFITVFALLTFLTGRGGQEVYTEEHLIRQFVAPLAILGWTPDPGCDR